MFGFKKKEQTTILELPQVDSDLSIKVAALQNLVLEQRLMIRDLLAITTMLAEHQRYELVQKRLHGLANRLDKVK